MSEVKVELLRLLKIPVTGLTVVIAFGALGIEVGSVSHIGMEGVKFHPGTMNQTKESKEVAVNNELYVSLPSNAAQTI